MHELLNRRHSLFSAALALLLGLCAIILWRNWPSTAYFSGGTDLEYRLTGYIDASFDPDEAAGQLETIAAGVLDRTVRVELLPADGGSCRLLVTASDGEELSYPEYLTLTNGVHTPQDLKNCFAMHRQFKETGSMMGVKWEK